MFPERDYANVQRRRATIPYQDMSYVLPRYDAYEPQQRSTWSNDFKVAAVARTAWQ